jgi:cytochrome b pre-mRNA-processing protein 3
MLGALKSFFSPPTFQAEAHQAYLAIVRQARAPFFYERCAVSDTLDGRFDVIVLHLFLVLSRLRRESSEAAMLLDRALQEVFFFDMDRSVRELGVSDTGVGKRVRNMAQAFYGRMQAYEQGLSDAKAFQESLSRNIYRGQDVAPAPLQAMYDYVLRAREVLQQQPFAKLCSGDIRFS